MIYRCGSSLSLEFIALKNSLFSPVTSHPWPMADLPSILISSIMIEWRTNWGETLQWENYSTGEGMVNMKQKKTTQKKIYKFWVFVECMQVKIHDYSILENGLVYMHCDWSGPPLLDISAEKCNFISSYKYYIREMGWVTNSATTLHLNFYSESICRHFSKQFVSVQTLRKQ